MEMVRSGDCGWWDPMKEREILAAHKILEVVKKNETKTV